MATLSPTGPRGEAAAQASGSLAHFASDFESFAAGRNEPAAVHALRRRAIDRFLELGFPTTKQEAWRFTDVSPIAKTEFARAEPDHRSAAPAVDVAEHDFECAARLVVVDGRLAPSLSHTEGLTGGAFVGSLADALEQRPDDVASYLGRHVDLDEHPFVALNSAFFADGVCILVPRGEIIEGTIHVLYLSTGQTDGEGRPLASYPRTLIVADEASQVTVVETFAGEGRYLSCSLTEISAAQSAVVDHYRVQHESHDAFHVATLQSYLERDANVFSHAVSTGGAITRNDVNAILDGPGAECTLNGLYLTEGTQLVDNHMRMDHVAPNCNSFELYKGVLDGSSRTVFNGLIHVHQDAQKTDAKQSNRNLLLSPGAMANSNPQLEIFADDVRCTHGSTVGQLDEEAVFYLRSRGIGERAAKSLLTYAFASDIVSRIKVDPVRQDLEELLFARLPRGEVVRQAV